MTRRFALAQVQQMNVDIHPGVLGKVTMNATDPTLLQIMDRLAVKGDIRYEITGNLLKLVPRDSALELNNRFIIATPKKLVNLQ
jgi:hypothetical protein